MYAHQDICSPTNGVKCSPIKCLTLTFADRYGLRTHVHVHGYIGQFNCVIMTESAD